MKTKLHAWRRGAVALLLGACSFVLPAGARSSDGGAAALLTTSVLAYDTHGAPVRPSAQYGLAVYDRQYSRVSASHGYYRHPYSGYRHYPYYYRPYYRPYYYGYGYPFSFYGAWGYPYYGYYGGWGYPAYGYYSDWSPDSGALDLNIKPKRAEVWVDREYLGTVDSYDGFPRYLWLQSGQHNLVVYLDGYETFAREVTLRAGEVIAIRFDLHEGVAKTPDELFAELPSVEPERAREAEERAERPQEPLPEPSRDDDWRGRSRQPVGDESSRVAVDQRSEPGRLRLVVTPADAVVYLDGRLLGSGDDLGRLHSDLLVDAGTHRLQVTRPGYRAWEREITLGEGEALVVRAELEAQ
jgi:hypothetical protein